MSALAALSADDTSTDRPDPLTILLDDPEWVTARFAEMMTAAGFGPRTVTGTMPRPPRRERRRISEATPKRHAVEAVETAGIRSRIRSPPDRR